MNDLPFAAVKAAAPTFAEQFCRQFLPTGKKTGGWWIARVPWRADKNPSLGVSLKTGKWQDFSLGDHGDMVDLLCRIDGIDNTESVKRLAAMMGVA